MTAKEIVDICSALLTPLIAVIATYIAYQQYHVSELTLKKELYDIIAKHSKQPYEKVWECSDRDYWMIAHEAKAFGMIDEILGSVPTEPAK